MIYVLLCITHKRCWIITGHAVVEIIGSSYHRLSRFDNEFFFFLKQSHRITWQADHSSRLNNFPSIKRLLPTDTASFHLLQASSPKSKANSPCKLCRLLFFQLLQSYQILFVEPTTLPPPRTLIIKSIYNRIQNQLMFNLRASLFPKKVKSKPKRDATLGNYSI